jgi:Ni,Fe-hydrogenase maturation factor
MKILVFGNPLIEKDSLALKLIPKLQKTFPEINFIHIDPTESLEQFGKNLNIIDVSPGIKEVKILNIENEQDLKILNTSKIFSMHDFDLGYNLKLLKKLKKIDSAEIICIPMGMKEEGAFESVKKILKSKSLNTT